jgi:hypothetical protein
MQFAQIKPFMQICGNLHGFSISTILCSPCVRENKQSAPALQETNMSASNKMKTLWRRAAGGSVLRMMMCVSLTLGLRVYAQTQIQPATPDSAQMSATSDASEVPPAVAKELQAVKVRMAQMESQLKDLAALVAPAVAVRTAHSAPTEVALIGTMSCGHCQGIQPMHKGYTQFSWALNSVSQGDDIVLVSRDQVYKLHGDKDNLLKFMSVNVRLTGRLDGSTLDVETIGRAVKGE